MLTEIVNISGDRRWFLPRSRRCYASTAHMCAIGRGGRRRRGTTTDVTVVDSSSPNFEAPSIEALLRWRYMPLVQNGASVERRGVQTVIRYQLDLDRV